jgi:heme/copper-type cytochrome/quinol oxidase subunit 1
MVLVQAMMIYLVGMLAYFVSLALEGRNSTYAQIVAVAMYLCLIGLCAEPLWGVFTAIGDHPLTQFLLRYPTRNL